MFKNKIKLMPVLIFACMIIFLYIAVSGTERGTEQEKFNSLKDAIERSAVQCYAIEGFYPPNVQYLKDHYGLIVDEEKYVISYSAFSSNLMPDITVFEK